MCVCGGDGGGKYSQPGSQDKPEKGENIGVLQMDNIEATGAKNSSVSLRQKNGASEICSPEQLCFYLQVLYVTGNILFQYSTER